MKKSFSLIEVIFILFLLATLYTFFIPKYKINKLDEIGNRITLYLSYLRYQALIDNKYSENKLWFKKRWTIKFFRCREKVGGIYFSIYSDKNLSGHPSREDTLKDPLTNKSIYSSNFCKETKFDSKYVLLTKNYDIKDVQISCNETTSLGQISFGNDGRVYSKLGSSKEDTFEYEIKEPCNMIFIDKKGEKRQLKIEARTGKVEYSK